MPPCASLLLALLNPFHDWWMQSSGGHGCLEIARVEGWVKSAAARGMGGGCSRAVPLFRGFLFGDSFHSLALVSFLRFLSEHSLGSTMLALFAIEFWKLLGFRATACEWSLVFSASFVCVSLVMVMDRASALKLLGLQGAPDQASIRTAWVSPAYGTQAAFRE